jgi:hypothetical protein
LCPDSPEAADHYVEFLTKQHRQADARLVLTWPDNSNIKPRRSFKCGWCWTRRRLKPSL